MKVMLYLNGRLWLELHGGDGAHKRVLVMVQVGAYEDGAFTWTHKDDNRGRR